MKVSDQLHASANLPRETTYDIHWIETWIGRSFGLDDVVKEKLSYFCRDQTDSVKIVARHYTDYHILGSDPNTCKVIGLRNM
jgi:hypothetical protein